MMKLIQDGVGRMPATLSGNLLKAPAATLVPLFDTVVALGEFQLVQAYLDVDRRAKGHRDEWSVSVEELCVKRDITVPNGEEETLEYLQRGANGAKIIVPIHQRTLTRFPDEVWERLGMNKNLINYGEVRRLLSERIAEKRRAQIEKR